nr:hypothetical protein [Actinopolyspora xinjiangensis]
MLERSGIRPSFGEASGTAEAVPMALELVVSELADGGTPFSWAVYVWHCDRTGRYSMYSRETESEDYLRGVQIAEEDDRVKFTSVFPACYFGVEPLAGDAAQRQRVRRRRRCLAAGHRARRRAERLPGVPRGRRGHHDRPRRRWPTVRRWRTTAERGPTTRR